MEKTELSIPPINLEVDEEVTKVYENQCLIGKILLPWSVDQTLVKSFTHTNWNCRLGLTVTKISRNMFMFVFQDQKDLTNVVKNTPWTIMGTGLMILSTCSSGEVTRELEFSYSPFWVQAHGLPLNYLTRRNGSNVGSILGTFICSDWHVSCVKISDKGYLRLRVSLDVRKPILTGFWLNRPGSLTRVRVDFKYENLGLFCYQCGRMGDSFRTCKFLPGPEKFGSWLRADLRDCCSSNTSRPVSRARSRIMVTPVDQDECTTLLAVPRSPEPNILDQSSSDLGDASSQQSMHFEQDENETTTSTRNLWQRLIMNGVDLMIMLKNRKIVLSRVTNLDGGEGIWTLFILMVVYIFHLYHKLFRVKRALRFLGAQNGPTPSDDDGDDRDGNALGEIIVSIVFLVLLYFF
ncbi:hypothetical protein ACP275_04G041700 [Erythranthe tilingii]